MGRRLSVAGRLPGIPRETLRGERADQKTGQTSEYMTFITTLEDNDFVVYRETGVTEKRRLEERIANALASLGVSPESQDESR